MCCIKGHFSLKSWLLVWGIAIVLVWKAPKTYNDIKFWKEAKTIIVVDVWLNSLSVSCLLCTLGKYVKRHVYPGIKGTHDKLNQISWCTLVSMDCVPFFKYVKRRVNPSNQDTHDKLNQIQLFTNSINSVKIKVYIFIWNN